MEQSNNSTINRGFTLLEVIVAIFILTVGILGCYSLIIQTISSTRYNSDKLVASYLAQEGIEIVRNIRDTNWLEQQVNSANPWNEGLDVDGLCDCTCDDMLLDGCVVDYNTPIIEDPIPSPFDEAHEYLNIDSSGFYSYSPGTQSKFKRKIVIYHDDLNGLGEEYILKVCARVEWEEKGRTQTVIVKENLYNWH